MRWTETTCGVCGRKWTDPRSVDWNCSACIREAAELIVETRKAMTAATDDLRAQAVANDGKAFLPMVGVNLDVAAAFVGLVRAIGETDDKLLERIADRSVRCNTCAHAKPRDEHHLTCGLDGDETLPMNRCKSHEMRSPVRRQREGGSDPEE